MQPTFCKSLKTPEEDAFLPERTLINKYKLSPSILYKDSFREILETRIDLLTSIKSKYKAQAIIDVAHLRIIKIAFLMAKQILEILRYIFTPIFLILGIYYCSRNSSAALKDEPLINTGLLFFTNKKIDQLPPFHSIRYRAPHVPCESLKYTEECPMHEASHYIMIHKTFWLAIMESEYARFSNTLFKRMTLCELMNNTSIMNGYPSLEIFHDSVPFLGLSLWATIMGVITSTAFIGDGLWWYRPYTNILHHIKKGQIHYTMNFLKKYLYNKEMDKEYTYMVMQALLAHPDYTLFAKKSTQALSKNFFSKKYTLQLNPNLKTELHRCISNEKIKLSHLLALSKILDKNPYRTIHKSTLSLLLMLLDILLFSCRFYTFTMPLIVLIHLICLTTFKQEEYHDDPIINTTVDFSTISAAYPIIDRFPKPTQRALIERLAMESIYSGTPLKKASTMEKVTTTINSLYDGRQLRSLFAIIEDQHKDFIKHTQEKILAQHGNPS